MEYFVYILILFLPILILIGTVVLIVVLAKKGAFSTKASPQISMRNGEVSILATKVVWMQKAMYLNKRKIPNGVLDITNQRVVYTRTSGDKVDFALEKDEVAGAILRGKIGVKIQAKDGTDYVINTMPSQKVLDALEQMGVPVKK